MTPNDPMSLQITVSLPQLRQSVDNIDSALLTLVAERFKITSQIGALKQSLNLPAIDPDREAAQRARIAAISNSLGLNPAFAERLWRAIVDEVVHNHLRAGPE